MSPADICAAIRGLNRGGGVSGNCMNSGVISKMPAVRRGPADARWKAAAAGPLTTSAVALSTASKAVAPRNAAMSSFARSGRERSAGTPSVRQRKIVAPTHTSRLVPTEAASAMGAWWNCAKLVPRITSPQASENHHK